MAQKTAAVIGLHVLAMLCTLTVLWFWLLRDAQWGLAHECVSARQTISASVRPASGVRCNRITLPPMWYYASAAPYNPAAARHPATGEWYLLHVIDQARPLALLTLGRGRACSSYRLNAKVVLSGGGRL
jgi:hypothetical protein